MSECVLILGATSGLGRALARQWAAEGCSLLLAGRCREELERTAADLALRTGAWVAVETYDARDFAGHPSFFEACLRARPDGIDGVVLCHGTLPDQRETQSDFGCAQRAIDVNFSSAVSLLNLAADHLERRGRGWICAISSVAGERGRRSNHLYGATKAALSTFLQGLEARLAPAGIAVLCVKPGFLDTGMTWGRAGLFAVASPERAAADIVRGIRRRRSVVYTPGFWSPIMAVIRWIPTRIFRRLPL